MKTVIAKKPGIFLYLYDKVTGTFIGFIIGMAATKMVSQFFTTRSIRNLWGLTANKHVIDKKTFSMLEWCISILIGFFVFEVMTKVVKKKFDEKISKHKFNRWFIRNFRSKQTLKLQLNENRIDNFESTLPKKGSNPNL